MIDNLGRLVAYEVLFQRSNRFTSALCSVFESLLEFSSWLRRKMYSKILFTDSLKRDVASRISRFRSLCVQTESEAQLAATEDFQNDASQFFKESRRRQNDLGNFISDQNTSSICSFAQRRKPLTSKARSLRSCTESLLQYQSPSTLRSCNARGSKGLARG